MVSAGFGVDTGALRELASAIQEAAEPLDQARAEAQQVALSKEAYGHLPDAPALIAVVHTVSVSGLQALQRIPSATSSLADAVRETTATYDQLDRDISAMLRELEL